MLRRISTIGLIALGVIVIGLAIASATAWRSSDTVTATVSEDVEAPFVVTDAGVLELVDDDVTVTATTPDGEPVVLAVGREPDVMAWVGDNPHVRITGLASWTSLGTATEEGVAPEEGDDEEAPSPAGSDMWVTEVTGEGEATLDWTAPGGRWSLLAASDGAAPAPAITMSWPQIVTTPFLVPGLVVGGLLLLGGLARGVWPPLARRARAPHDSSRSEEVAATGEVAAVVAADEGGGDATSAGLAGGTAIAAGTDAPTVQLTRHQVKELAEAQATEPKERPATGDEVVPVGEGDSPEPPAAEEPGAEPEEPPAAEEPASTSSPGRRVWGLRAAGRAAGKARRATDAPVGDEAPREEPSDEGTSTTDEEDRA